VKTGRYLAGRSSKGYCGRSRQLDVSVHLVVKRREKNQIRDLTGDLRMTLGRTNSPSARAEKHLPRTLSTHRMDCDSHFIGQGDNAARSPNIMHPYLEAISHC